MSLDLHLYNEASKIVFAVSSESLGVVQSSPSRSLNKLSRTDGRFRTQSVT